MTTPTLTGMSYFNDSTKNSVEREIIDADANLFNIKIPGFGADTGNLSITFLGKQRLITVQGNFAGTDSDIANFRSEFDAQVMNPLSSDKNYQPSDGGTVIRVQVARFTVTREFSQPFKVTYTLDLLTTNSFTG